MATHSENDLRAGRGARTQAMFRAVNEQVKGINEAFSDVVALGDWTCECFDQSCSKIVALTIEEYESLRADPKRFGVAPGDTHVDEAIERVVKKNDRYWIVEKMGLAADLATRVDPRAAS
jgi:hypothetical protein